MNNQAQTKKYPALSITYVLIFLIGASCMAVAGFFLIEGLSEFSGNVATTRMLIVGGVLFQITESICFISASALTYHSLRWRYILFTLGAVLFCFSIGVMTLAQKTALQVGETQASAFDEKRNHLRKQIISLDKVIESYRYNAKRQSRSIYKDSRAKGQDSLNRAAKLEERKLKLAEQLFVLNKARRQTSADFFKRIEKITGMPAASTEFYFLVARSLLLELSAIILMSFAANLRAYNRLVIESQSADVIALSESLTQKVVARLRRHVNAGVNKTLDGNLNDSESSRSYNNEDSSQNSNSSKVEEKKDNKVWLTQSKINNESSDPPVIENDIHVDDMEFNNESEYDPLASNGVQSSVTKSEMNILFSNIVELHRNGILTNLSAEGIQVGMIKYCNKKIPVEIASELARLVANSIDEPC